MKRKRKRKRREEKRKKESIGMERRMELEWNGMEWNGRGRN